MKAAILGFAALALATVTVSAVTTSASAEKIIVKDVHHHWHPRPHKVVVVERGHHHE